MQANLNLDLQDLNLGERMGTVTFRDGKGGKQRVVPVPLLARRAVLTYLESRPQVESQKVFIGERGPMTDRGIRSLCSNPKKLQFRQRCFERLMSWYLHQLISRVLR